MSFVQFGDIDNRMHPDLIKAMLISEITKKNPTDTYIFKSQYPFDVTIYLVKSDGKKEFRIGLSPFGKIKTTKKELNYDKGDFLVVEVKGEEISEYFALPEECRYIQIGNKDKLIV